MLKSCFKVLQIEGERFLCLPVDKAGFSVRAEVKNLSRYYNQGFSEHRRSRGSSVRPRHHGYPFKKDLEAAHPALDGTFYSLCCSHQTREVTQAGKAAGSWVMLPPGHIFHLNCAYSAVGLR